ncbi:MAG: membrane protein [Phycisphaerae bacterium]|nr:MAG: TerC family protein [Planctomycetia bacterium]GJQ26588.1 MAG: membrane protein [Phycisphaerae bacterium]
MEFWLWGGFVAFVLIMLALDLGVLNRKAHVVNTREALIWAGFCVFLALMFNVFLYFAYDRNWFDIATRGGTLSGKAAAMQFFTGWLIEQSLSLDNIFVIALIFQYFSVPRIHQHRTLFWGIIGALAMRMAMILAGAALIQRFTWTIYVFGVLLLYTAVKMYRSQDEAVEPNRNPLVKLARKLYPVTDEFHGEKFFVRVDGRRAITPLFLVLLVIESTDLLFAVDSIPAIFAITKDPFIVFTSNVFAILNLRSLYFVLASMLEKFKYLKPSLVFVLAYVGVKMLVSHHYHIPTAFSLAVIIGILAVGILASVISSQREKSRSA